MQSTEQDDRIDKLILAVCTPRWQKVAMVISRLLLDFRVAAPAEEVGARISRLVDSGQLEAQGDVSLFRHSEVRLPSE